MNTVINCPLNERCGCKCQAKIVQTPTQTVLFIADKHTAADHVADKDRAKFLKFKDTCLRTYVRHTPLPSPRTTVIIGHTLMTTTSTRSSMNMFVASCGALSKAQVPDSKNFSSCGCESRERLVLQNGLSYIGVVPPRDAGCWPTGA